MRTPMLKGSERPRLHLLTSFANTNGGSENRTLELHAHLQPHAEVLLWSDDPPDPGFSGYPINVVHPYRGEFPHGGTLVILGPHTRIGQWLQHAGIARTIVVANLHPYHYLFDLLEALHHNGIDAPEIVYASDMLRREIGLPGTVEASPIDLSLFVPAASHEERPFTLGRLSRDQPFKHHPKDPHLYKMLAAEGCRVRIMGGTLLHGVLGDEPGIELLKEGAAPAPDFLRGLDCFFYRTAEQWCEPSGRVVFEAMACGLPVVCGRRGGYAENIRHGVNGFLVDTQEEAYDILMTLRRDKSLRQEVGLAARQSVEAIYNDAYWRETLRYYAGSLPGSPP